jgi:hypothetical protein
LEKSDSSHDDQQSVFVRKLSRELDHLKKPGPGKSRRSSISLMILNQSINKSSHQVDSQGKRKFSKEMDLPAFSVLNGNHDSSPVSN